MKKLCIIGAGSWSTALCKIFSASGLPVNWWFHREEDSRHFQALKHNPRYLSDVDFSGKSITVFTDVKEAISGCDVLLLGVPSAYVASVLVPLAPIDLADKKIITSVKGILPEELKLVTHYLEEHFGVSKENLAVIGGPCHAEEVALEKQSYLTVASLDDGFAAEIKSAISSRYIAVTLSKDLEGLEWAAVLKNVYAIACGVCHGLGFGDNFQAVLVSNAMEEMNFFLSQKSPFKREPLKSAYLGDLLVTAYSTFSRNRTFGNMIGRGYSVKAAQFELGMIAEGYYAVHGLHKLSKTLNLHLPIADTMFQVLYQSAPAREAIEELRRKLS